VNHIQEQLIGEFRLLWIEAEDTPFLLRPKQFSGRRVPSPTPRVANFFSLGQVEFAALKCTLRVNAIGDFSFRTDDLDDLPELVCDRMTYAVDVFDRSAAKQEPIVLSKILARMNCQINVLLDGTAVARMHTVKKRRNGRVRARRVELQYSK
jgi:hypothetical protein